MDLFDGPIQTSRINLLRELDGSQLPSSVLFPSFYYVPWSLSLGSVCQKRNSLLVLQFFNEISNVYNYFDKSFDK